jgi:L-cysteine:1D-myo-inositol 2-amino-2-deoxy-alpha-D-glucopyranoside ligase
MRLFDTARQAVVPFEPGPVVTMYTCGITPYDATHLGHAAVFVFYDVLQRRLRDTGRDTKCVRNVTDVDDPLFDKARQLGVHYLDLAASEEARFLRDMDALNVIPPYSEPRASSAIPDIRGFIGMVLDSGHAYQAGGSVYFDVSSFPSFGALSHYSEEQMLAAARGGNVEDPHKRHPLDFSCSGIPRPPTNRRGRRCGVRAVPGGTQVLGPRPARAGHTIDLHGGGTDLIFPHHECERAQSEAVTGEPFVRHWLHIGMVRKDGEKMSKSLGNLAFVDQLRKTWDPRAIRLAIVQHRYRDSWDWYDELLVPANARLERWLGSGRAPGKILDEVRAALDDDLDTPRALAVIDEASDRGEDATAAAALLGVVLD